MKRERVLLRPHRSLILIAMTARLPISMAAVGLLTISLARGLGAGVAGTATGLWTASVAVTMPWWGRRTEIHGPRRVLGECLAGQVLGSCLLATAGTLAPANLAAAIVLGASTPPLAAMMRATWNRIFANDPDAAGRLAVVETMVTEILHITGRIVVAVLSIFAVWLIPAVYVVLMTVGSLRLRRDPDVSPPRTTSRPVRDPRRASRPTRIRRLRGTPDLAGKPPDHGLDVSASAGRASQRGSIPGTRRRGSGTWNGVTVAWGGVLLLMATSHGTAATAMVVAASPTGRWQGAVTMAIWGVGSLLGGAWSLRRAVLPEPTSVLLVSQAVFTTGACALGLLNLPLAGSWPLVLLLGAPISPAVSAVFRAVRGKVLADAEVRLFASFTSLNFLGFSLGAAAAGWVAELAGTDSVWFAVAAIALLAAVPGLLATGRRG